MLKTAIISRDAAVYRALWQEQKDFLRQEYDLVYSGGQEDVDIALLAQCEVLLSEPDIASQLLNEAKALKWLQSTWAGNNVLQDHSKRDYLLSGVKGIFSAKMREYVFAYILYFQRRISDFQSAQSVRKWQQIPTQSLSGKTLGIMGLGSIGQSIAQCALAFDMKVSGLVSNVQARARSNSSDTIKYYDSEDILEFLKPCDYIVNLLPETKETQALADEHFFEGLKAGAVFINAGRGSLLKSPQVLIEALNAGQLQAAVLDVFESEPLPADSPFYEHEDILLSNHTAAVSDPKMVFEIFCKNLDRYAKNEPLLYLHDFTKGY